MLKIELLAKFLNVNVKDLKVSEYDENIIELGEKEYLIVTDVEAKEKTREYILDSVWAFNPSFIANHTKGGYNPDLEKSIEKIQEQCEGANFAILAMIENEEEFIEDAIIADGRGHFLSPYDGVEKQYGEYYIYRIN